jgi:hypothetical protein
VIGLPKCHVKLRSTAFIAACVFHAGCGFLLTEGPPAGHEQMGYFSCTESKVGPTIDHVIAGLNIASLVIAASDEAVENREAVIGTGAAYAFFYMASGIVGNNRVDDCRRAKAQLASRTAPGQAAGTGAVSEWVTVTSWAGSGNQATQRFRASASNWRVTWTASNPGHGAFMYIAVLDADGAQVTRGAEQRGAGSGQLHVSADPGEYSLEIVAVNLDWEIQVEER